MRVTGKYGADRRQMFRNIVTSAPLSFLASSARPARPRPVSACATSGRGRRGGTAWAQATLEPADRLGGGEVVTVVEEVTRSSGEGSCERPRRPPSVRWGLQYTFDRGVCLVVMSGRRRVSCRGAAARVRGLPPRRGWVQAGFVGRSEFWGRHVGIPCGCELLCRSDAATSAPATGAQTHGTAKE